MYTQKLMNYTGVTIAYSKAILSFQFHKTVGKFSSSLANCQLDKFAWQVVKEISEHPVPWIVR